MENNFQHYNVHYEIAGIKRKVCITALNKEDALKTFRSYARIEGNSYGIPFECEPTKAIGPLGRIQTPKQKLAQQYRSCIGALKMAESNIRYISTGDSVSKETQTKNGAIKHVLNSMRDVKDLFKRLGLNIK